MDLPFLYQTRTILRVKPKCCFRPRTQIQRNQHTGPAIAHGSFFSRKAEEVAAARERKPTPNTMTQAEKAALDRLRRMAGQRQQKARLGIIPEPGRLDTDPDNILSLYTPQRPAENITSEETDGDSDATAEAALQEAHATEVDRIIHEISTGELHALSIAFRNALDSTTQPGDVALWGVLETHVFPLLGLLKASRRPPRPSQSKKTQAATNAAIAALEAEKAAAEKLLPLKTLVSKYATDKSKPPVISPLQVLSRYYPAALLLALRLLTKIHPLSLQSHRLLPHLRTLGPSSYILGVTTPFYNTYLFLRWNAYSSLSEVCTILSDMERGAVEFDQGTARFLADLATDRTTDLEALQRGESAATGDEVGLLFREPGWWMLPEQKRWWPTIEEWRGKVTRALEERGIGDVIREGPSSGVGDLPFEDAAPPQVWL